MRAVAIKPQRGSLSRNRAAETPPSCAACVALFRRFLRCHLVASRRPEPEECRGVGSDPLQCLPLLSPTNFQLFTSFVVHADVMCQHIAEQLHQRLSREASSALMQASVAAERSMQMLSSGMEAVVEDQKSVVRSQSVVVDSVRHAAAALREHHERLRASVASLADTSEEAFERMQSKLGRIDSTLGTILDLETSIAGFVDSAGAAVWYVSVVAVAWVASSSPQTARSRPAMLLLTALAASAEWATWWAAGRRPSSAPSGAAWQQPLQLLHERASDIVSFLRWLHVLTLAGVMLWHWVTFTDTGVLALQKLASLVALLGKSSVPVVKGAAGSLIAPSRPPAAEETPDSDSDSGSDSDLHADPCEEAALPRDASHTKRASSSKRSRRARNGMAA